MDDTPEIKDRFENMSGHLRTVQREVYTLEDWLNVHPFPKHKHGYKYIRDLLNH